MKLAVLLPCYNEEAVIAETVAGFRAALPAAEIFVYDNASTDQTAERAAEAGARVRHEALKGKGNVVRRMFADIDADVFILADGDATYDPAEAPRMAEMLADGALDMVVGVRRHEDDTAYRPGHQFGNRVLTGLVRFMFGNQFTDILSGYRVMSRRFVKTFPSLSKGFEIETELTVHALEIRAPVAEHPTKYAARREGSASKLNTVRDGLRILRLIFDLFREERPLAFFGAIAIMFGLASVVMGAPVVAEYYRTGLVSKIPTWIFAVGLSLAALYSFGIGLVLDTVTRGRREAKRFAYLSAQK